MSRISSYNFFNTNASGLMRAQSQLEKIQNQSASEQVATDLKGFGSTSERIVSTKSTLNQLEAKANTLSILSARASVEEVAYESFTDAISTLKQALTDAISNDTGNGLDEYLMTAFADATSAANTKYNGEYIFSGVSSNVEPFTGTSLDSVASADSTDTYWPETGETRKVSLGDGASIELSSKAEDVFKPFLDLVSDVVKWQNENSSFGSDLTDDQTEYIRSIISQLDSIQSDAIDYQSVAGTVQSQIESKQEENTTKTNVMTSIMGDMVDVDMTEVAAQLTAAQTQYQIAAEIFSQMSNISLLNYLD